MEGYTDVIVAHQYGFTNAVAVLGHGAGSRAHQNSQALSPTAIVLVLDGDEAGTEADERSAASCSSPSRSICGFSRCPMDSTRAIFCTSAGPRRFSICWTIRPSMRWTMPILTETRGKDIEHDVHAASQSLDRLVSIVAKTPRLRPKRTGEDRYREEKILQRIAARYRIDEREVREQLTAERRRAQSRSAMRSSPFGQKAAPQEEQNIPPETLDSCQKGVLEILLAFPEALAEMREQLQLEWLGNGSCRTIFEVSCHLADQDLPPTFDRLMTEFDDPAMKNLLVEYDESGQSKGLSALDYRILLHDLIKNFEQKEIERKRPTNVVEIREGKIDPRDVLKEIIEAGTPPARYHQVHGRTRALTVGGLRSRVSRLRTRDLGLRTWDLGFS